jgi:hypothetical protein
MKRALWAALGLTMVACGYAPVHGVPRDVPRLGVVLADAHAGDAATGEALRLGAMQGLAARGLARAGEAYPRLELELLRIDRVPEGLAEVSTERGRQPLARAFRVVLTGRAWVAISERERTEETGDLSVEIVRVAGRGAEELALDSDSIRLSAQKLGRALAQKIQGEPSVESSP